MTEPDPFGRPPITPDIKQAIRDAFAIVPEGKSSAVLAIFDEHGGRLHMAWRVNSTWQVGAVLNVAVGGKSSGSAVVVGAW